MKIAEGALEAKNQKRQRRPDMVAHLLRERIVDAALKPGDRIPHDWLLPEAVKVSRGTLREALKVLEFQGLITTRSGPGGGVFVSAFQSEGIFHLRTGNDLQSAMDARA